MSSVLNNGFTHAKPLFTNSHKDSMSPERWAAQKMGTQAGKHAPRIRLGCSGFAVLPLHISVFPGRFSKLGGKL